MKRLRTTLKRDGYENKLRYFAVGEYGSITLRPHYHAIMFNLPFSLRHTLELAAYLEKIWQKGFVQVGTVTSASINYVLKYIIDVDNPAKQFDDLVQPFRLMSKGLGLSYCDSIGDWHRQDPVARNYCTLGYGVKRRIPRYYRKKLFTLYDRSKQFRDNQRRLSDVNLSRSGETLSEFRYRDEQRQHFEEKTRRKLKGRPNDGQL